MGLPDLVLRAVAMKALKGNTFCAGRVLDSPIDPIDTIQNGATITIYTGEAHANPTNKSLMDVQWKTDFSFHMHLPSTVETGPGLVGTRGGGGEMLFDVLWRQILKSLYALDNKWAALWREAIIEIDSMQSRPFMIEIDKGIRIPAREVIFAAQTIGEPQFGTIAPDSWWGKAIALFESDSDPQMQSLGTFIRAETIGINEISSQRALQAYLGLSDNEFAAIGLSSAVPGAVPPQLDMINISAVNDGMVTTDGTTSGKAHR